ncbi:hypothetical protein [uncultured Psychroserpens sp.]|uniref:hypothetical protein n=1 Tax=uncultured Psychroserpens sp. TaxID=255436 RepID=UPI002608218A|nr:hypothetical protein [uncultured Psychroserpens sp.]
MTFFAINSLRYSEIKRIGFLVAFIFGFHPIFAQTDTPCEGAQRWTQGSTWLPDGSIDDAPNAAFPNGIIRCGSSAETQSQVMPYNNSVYNSSQFEIDISGIPCVDPSTQTTVFPANPTNGEPIIWLNFDVRAFAGSFEIQINDNSGDEIAWVLYSSNAHQAGTTLAANNQELSGDCGDLKRIACGVESSSTWNTIPIEGEDFLEPANLYLAIWDQGADGDLAVNNFKARFGCGDSDQVICSLGVEDPIVSCAENGTYSVSVPVNGANGQYTATDPNAISVSNDICLGNLGGGAISGSFTLTYNQGTDFNIDISPVIPSTNGCVDPLNPTQCTANVSGLSPPPGTEDIIDNAIVCSGDSYVWPVDGISYTLGDSPVVLELTDANDCPYTATLTITEYDVTPDDSASGEVCVGETFEYEGNDYAVGSHDIPKTDANGCPYTTVLTVTAYDVTPDDAASGEVCVGETFEYEGNDYAVGSHDIPRTDANGCPYKTILTVTAYDVTPDDAASGEVCVGETFEYEGNDYAVGSHDIPKTDANGCPYKTVLTVTAYDVTPDDAASGEVCVGETFEYEGNDYAVGSYDIPRTDANGCPYKTVLTVTAYDVTPDDAASGEVCVGETFEYEGNDYAVGSHDIPRTDANGCPYKTVLTVTAYDVTPDDTASGEVCEGNKYTYEGLEYEVGVYDIPKTDANGCPYTTVLTVTTFDTTPDVVDNVTICEGDSYLWSVDGGTYSISDSPVELDLIDANGCPYSATLTITEDDAPDAGENGALTVCEDVTPTNEELFEALEGNPDAGGVWSGPVNGMYTYTFAASGSCPEVSATVTVDTYDVTPDDAASGEVCVGETFEYEGNDYAVGSYDIPRTDANGCPYKTVLTVTAYDVTPDDAASGEVCVGETFEYEGNDYAVGSHDIPRTDANGCPYKTVLTVTAYDVTPDDTASGEVCEGNKYTYEGLEYEVGVYDIPKTDANGCPYTTVLTVTTFDTTPDVVDNVTICEGDSYLWSVDGATYSISDSPVELDLIDANGCPYSATLTITEDDAPDAGENGALTVCEDVTPTNEELFEALEGNPDAGGVWSGPVNGMYTYTFAASGSCPEVSATVTVDTYDVTPDDAASGEVCVGETFEYEGNDYAVGSHDIPRTDANGCPYKTVLTVTAYDVTPDDAASGEVCVGETFEYEGNDYAVGSHDIPKTDVNGCPYTTVLTVTAYDVTPDDTASGEVCEGNTFNYEGIEYGVGSHDIPKTDANGCPYTTVLTVTTFDTTPDVVNNVTICEGDSYLWSVDGATYSISDSPVELDLIDANGCPYSATLTITEDDAPDAGENGALTVCEDVTPTNEELFEALEGNPDAGGVWSGPVNGMYTYTFAASGSCPEVSATVTVDTYDVTPDDAASGEVCEGNTFNYEGNDYAVGSHDIPRTDANGCPYKTVLTVTTYDVTPDDAASGEVCVGETFEYEGNDYAVGSHDIPRTDANGCPYKTVLTVTAYDVTPDDTASGEVCEGNTFNYEGIEYGVGSYDVPKTDSNGCPYITVLTISAYDVTENIEDEVTICKEDSYTWSVNGETYTAADSPVELDLVDANGCPYSATLIINEDTAPDPGEDGVLTVCENVTPTNEELFEALEGNPDTGGIWSGPVNGVYKYMFEASGSCPEVYATVTVYEYDATENIDEVVTVCFEDSYLWDVDQNSYTATDSPVELELIDANGCPYTATLTILEHPRTENIEDEASICGDETYLWEVDGNTYSASDSPVELNLFDDNGCPYTATLIINQSTEANAGENGILTVCEGVIPTFEELFEALGGNPDPGGIWTGPLNGEYTYTFVGSESCPGSSAIVKVYEYPKKKNIKDEVTVCYGYGYRWDVDGNLYFAEDSPVILELANENGCSYTATLIIDEYPEPERVLHEVTVCLGGSYTWPLTGETYTAADSPIKTKVYDENGCLYKARLEITENETVIGSHPYVGPICLEDGPVILSGGQPAGGIYSGIGVIDNEDGTYSIDPSALGTGVHDIEYVFALGSKCQDSVKFEVEIVECCVDETAYAFAPNSGANEWCFIESTSLVDNSNWGWTNGGLDLESQNELGDYNTYTFDLYAGSGNDCDPNDENSPGVLVGYVTVERSGDEIYVTYTLDEGDENVFYRLDLVHVYAGCGPYPCIGSQTGRLCAPTTAPGQYPYSGVSNDGNSATIVFSIDDIQITECLANFYLIAHAEVQVCEIPKGDKKKDEQRSVQTDTSVDFKAYPVPYTKEINIAYVYEFDTDVSIQVMDVRGMLLKDISVKDYIKGYDGISKIDLSNINDQILFVKVTTSKGTMVKKIISSNKK